MLIYNLYYVEIRNGKKWQYARKKQSSEFDSMIHTFQII